MLLAPIVASFAVTRLLSPGLWHPGGAFGLIVFVIQVAAVGTVAALVAQRALRRFLPLATLLNLTLVFPDRAPSRFGVALRAGSLTRLRDSLDVDLPSDHQLAAERLVELVTALGRHERLTRGHTERVRAYSDLIAEEMGLSVEARQKLAWAAMIHDVGKLTVPAEILSLPGKPNDEQWAILRNHPTAGGHIVEPLAGWLGEWRLAASQHHERWDGGGYPLGLAGTEISLAGRIVAVADAYDVITSARSYKSAMSPQAARDEMVRCSGTQFDPDVVRALLKASLGRERRRVSFLGWLPELGFLALVPRGITHAAAATTSTAAATTTAAAVTVAAVAGTTTLIEPVDFGTNANAQAAESSVLAFVDEEPVDAGELSSGERPGGDLDGLAPEPSTVPTAPPPASDPEPSILVASTATTPGETLPTSSTSASSTTSVPITTTTANRVTTTTTTVPTTTPLATATVPQVPMALYLGSGGHTSSQPVLPAELAVSPGTLPNYDTDRDGDPGLMIKKGKGLDETDPTKRQRWAAPILSPLAGQIAIDPVVHVWVATKDFDTGKIGSVEVGVYDCDASHGDCQLLSYGYEWFDQWDFDDDFGEVVVTMSPIDHAFAPGRSGVLVIATADDSDDDLWFAYGTSDYPSRIEIG